MRRCDSFSLVLFKFYNRQHYVSREFLKNQLHVELMSKTACSDCKYSNVLFAVMKEITKDELVDWWCISHDYNWQKFTIIPLVHFILQK